MDYNSGCKEVLRCSWEAGLQKQGLAHIKSWYCQNVHEIRIFYPNDHWMKTYPQQQGVAETVLPSSSVSAPSELEWGCHEKCHCSSAILRVGIPWDATVHKLGSQQTEPPQRCLSAFNTSTAPLLLSFSLLAATNPYSLQARENVQADFRLQGMTFSTDLSLTSRYFVLIQVVLVFWVGGGGVPPIDWKIFTRRCGDHTPAQERAACAASHLFPLLGGRGPQREWK